MSKEDLIAGVQENYELYSGVQEYFSSHEAIWGQYFHVERKIIDGVSNFSSWSGSSDSDPFASEKVEECEDIKKLMDTVGCWEIVWINNRGTQLRFYYDNAIPNSGVFYTEGDPGGKTVPIDGCENWYYYFYPLEGH